jgi:hypothetical protein
MQAKSSMGCICHSFIKSLNTKLYWLPADIKNRTQYLSVASTLKMNKVRSCYER